jgi:hypothetical protein
MRYVFGSLASNALGPVLSRISLLKEASDSARLQEQG